MVALSCIAFSVACDGASEPGEPPGNTEVDILISSPGSTPDELAFNVDYVSYRIACPASGLSPYDDSVELFGSFEIDDGRTTPVWQFITNLPPALCTISLWVFYEDEVVCSGSQSKLIVEDGDPATTNKFDIVLECTLSVNADSGNAQIDGTFDLVHGNYCPQLVWLGAVPSAANPAVMNVQTSSFDLDMTCGQNCDPQTCDFSSGPPTCTPGPDNGMTSTLYAPSGNGSFGDPGAFDTTYACDPLFPGVTEICVAVSDGDLECDQIRCTTVVCPDLCQNVDCDDGNECTGDFCNPVNGLCTNDPAPDGIACDNCNSTCQAGICDAGTPFIATVNASVMTMSGGLQTLNTTEVNPYSGETLVLSGTKFVNTSSYKGVGANDLLLGTVFGDVLKVYDLAGAPPEPPQRICGVEELRADNGFDAMLLADDFIVLGDMDIYGGNAGDVLWANAGNDIVRGLTGNDRLDAGPGDDTVEGGEGADTIVLWPGSGFDSISGGLGADQVEIDAEQNQILISPAANPIYEFDVFYLGTPMAQIREVELLVLNDAFIDLATCTAGVCNVCGNGALNWGEACDDGNSIDGDGCEADCTTVY
jgi:cysteine-rich repeat protein